MPIRITGMNSGLDTESIITELVKAKSTKKDNLVKAQTKLQWKQDAWKELNTKVYALYSKTLSNMRLSSDYVKKTTKVSNANAVSVITGANAVNGVQTVKVDQLAKTGYLTGAKLEAKDGKYTSSTSLTDADTGFGIAENSELELTVNGETTTITVTKDMTINDLVSTLKKAGLNANFDEKNQRFFISAKETGKAADFSLTANDANGMAALQKLGIAAPLADDDAAREKYSAYCDRVEVVDANGVKSYQYKAKDAAALDAMITKEYNERVERYNSAKKEIADVQSKIKDLKDKYGEDGLESQEELEKSLSEKEEKLNKDTNLSEEDRKKLEDEITDLKKKVEDRKTLDDLEAKEKEYSEAIKQDDDYFVEEIVDGVVTYKAKTDDTGNDVLKDRITGEISQNAEFAAKVLNGGFVSSGATRIAGQDAVITLNGAEFTSTDNTFEINGLTITANIETAEEFTITTADDTDGIYDMIKNFFKEYNTLINEMDKLYNADSSKGYEPLTDEEKEAMSEKEIEKWEEKIKDSILRRDSTLSTVSSAMKQVMLQGVTMSDGSKMYLSEFGIETLGYFTSSDNEKNAYHIDGDPDDSNTMTNADKLKTAIANDPDMVIEFFSTLSKNLYEKLGDLMKKTDYSSSFTLYDDVAMKDEYEDYTSKISDQEEKIKDFEDRYYNKFSAMEVALAKLQSKESALSGLFGN